MEKDKNRALLKNSNKKRNIVEALVIFFLFLSAAFSISYWAIAKYDVYSDYTACGDAQQYIKMSRHDYSNVQQRYRNRPLMPFIVSLLNDHLKIDNFLNKYYENVENKIIQLNFGIVNILAIALTALLFFYYCIYLNFSKWESLVGSFLFLTSFFVVTYFTIPMVDSLSAFFIMAGFYAVLRSSLLGLSLSFLLGVFTKETTFVILPLILLEERRLFTKKLLVCLPGIISYIIFVIFFQDKADATFYIFKDVVKILKGNFIQVSMREFSFYTLIENIQIFMFLWILFIYALFKCKKPVFLKRVVWLLIIPVFTPLLPGAVVGRAVFYLFPIVIPFALLALRDILVSKVKENY
ncbi:MAG: hypothetical protein Q8O13_07070 [Candidatus Omnitrophota bacterium]|nr:hypothetical protein [Candidatus Omnitrophota bacterium]